MSRCKLTMYDWQLSLSLSVHLSFSWLLSPSPPPFPSHPRSLSSNSPLSLHTHTRTHTHTHTHMYPEGDHCILPCILHSQQLFEGESYAVPLPSEWTAWEFQCELDKRLYSSYWVFNCRMDCPLSPQLPSRQVLMCRHVESRQSQTCHRVVTPES